MKRLEIVVVILIVGALWFSGLHLIAAIVGVGSWAVLSYREFQTKQLLPRPRIFLDTEL